MSAVTTLLLVGLVVVALGLLLVAVHRRLGDRREPAGLAGFLRHFDPDEVAEDVVIAVYRQIERWEAPTPPRPEHDLARHYGLLPEEVRQAVIRVARECGREPGDAGAVRTVGEWVQHVSARPPVARAAD